MLGWGPLASINMACNSSNHSSCIPNAGQQMTKGRKSANANACAGIRKNVCMSGWEQGCSSSKYWVRTTHDVPEQSLLALKRTSIEVKHSFFAISWVEEKNVSRKQPWFPSKVSLRCVLLLLSLYFLSYFFLYFSIPLNLFNSLRLSFSLSVSPAFVSSPHLIYTEYRPVVWVARRKEAENARSILFSSRRVSLGAHGFLLFALPKRIAAETQQQQQQQKNALKRKQQQCGIHF